MISYTSASAARGPVLGEERSLAPDLARGAMLLLIALANAPGVAPGTPADLGHVSLVERAANFLMTTFVHARAYPVFAVMFGYSLVQLAMRQERAGAGRAGVRSILLRRNAWLVVFGFFHAALLYFADFLGAYGLIGITATLILLNSERIQRALMWLWILPVIEIIGLCVYIGIGLADPSGAPADLTAGLTASAVADNYVASIFLRLPEWLMHTATVLPAIFVVNLGMWAARRRMLEDLAAHAKILRRVAWGGLAIAFTGALPYAALTAGLLQANEQISILINILHKITGMFGGPGYIAAIALFVLGTSRANRKPAASLVRLTIALGRRSLSGYLIQSLAWLLLFAPYTLALGYRVDSALLASLAAAASVWLATLFGAGLCERYGYRGPAEVLLRRLTYGSRYKGAAADPAGQRV